MKELDAPVNRLSVKIKLAVILISFALIPSLIVGVVSYFFARNLSQRYELNVEVLAADLSKQLTETFALVSRNLQLLSEKTEFYDAAGASPGTEVIAIAEILKETVSTQNLYRYLIVTDINGNIVATQEPGSSWVGKSLEVSAELTKARQGQLMQSAPGSFTLFDQAIVGFWTHAPIYSAWDKATPVGIVSGFSEISQLAEVALSMKIDGKPQDQSRYVQVFDAAKGSALITPTFMSPADLNQGTTLQARLGPEQASTRLTNWKDSWNPKIVGLQRNAETGILVAVFVDEAIVYRNISTLKNFIILFMCGIVVVAGIFVLPISRIFTTPLFRLLEGVKIIGAGDLNHKVKLSSHDEFGVLGQAFDSMTDQLKNSQAIIEQKNLELTSINQNLEKMVEERTRTIQTILTNVKSGFLIVDARLQIMEGFTRSCLDLFGPQLKAGMKLSAALGLKGKKQDHVDVALDQVFSDVFPSEVSLSQIPERFRLGDKVLALQGSVLRSGDEVSGILYTVVDATKLEKAEIESQTNWALVKIIQNKDAFRSFLAEMKVLLKQGYTAADDGDQDRMRSALHTIKGNAASFGLREAAEITHQIEEKVAIQKADISLIETTLRDFLSTHQSTLELSFDDDDSGEILAIHKNELDKLGSQLQKARNLMEAVEAFDTWLSGVKQKTARALLGPLQDYTEALAARLGKNIHLVIEGGQTTMQAEIMMPILQSLTHLIRNSIDHGIEAPWERQGKPETGMIRLHFEADDQAWRIEITDDGRGINGDAVLRKAVERGLISASQAGQMSHDDRCQLIFLGGLSTAEAVTDVSGRGVGMAAVAEAIHEAKGTIHVSSSLGQGTKFEIHIPKPGAASQSGKARIA
ncbi:ATP-binding protein [Oligoflexus tunisiensis]|uniref:ATP-binding protein n=1 Tax=Oligoflexus tunisiensis TaxID=708132 RepID=UPI000AA13A2B|nr:ATP-binding protein [Oligoflexus tunisiensis]